MTLRLYMSNRLEILARHLAGLLETPLPSPFQKEVIVVQSRGMERWVSMQLAQRHGICANCRFPFPNHFVGEVFKCLVAHSAEDSPFNPRTMTWRVMDLLPGLLDRAEFHVLRTYLADPPGDLKRLQLSERIADTFDQYLIFRPDMISRWEDGEGRHWQAVLWRELVKGWEGRHPAALRNAFLEALRKAPEDLTGLPERISVFGISALPMFHLEVLAAISSFTRIHLLLMNPCREYWGQIVPDREIKRVLAGQKGRPLTPEDLHLEEGNSLLASMGKLGRDFFHMIHGFPVEEEESYEEPGEKGLLHAIQSHILNLREGAGQNQERHRVSLDDTSIQVHACHSPMREMEVLRDHFLNLFDRDPALLPGHILVMTPDIETYTPYIQAVFDVPQDDPRRIPFSIADRSIRKESMIIDPFMALLHLHGSRLGASQVLSLLEAPSLRGRFGLHGRDLSIIRTWVLETRIKWGMDETTREQKGIPAIRENTWRDGLQRLLLGYAMPGREERLFSGILPYDHVEGSETLLMGSVLEFAEGLFDQLASMDRPRTLTAWSEILLALLDRFFLMDGDTEREAHLLRSTLSNLKSLEETSGFHGDVDLGTIRWHLGRIMEGEGLGLGFLTGGVTFCAMLPMRSIPFRHICLVGMNGDAYPRRSQPVGFDLMAQDPRPGDRSRRHDDRYLFLEALLSAREIFYISYVGQSLHDNSPIPPSVLVSEILDYVERFFGIEEEDILQHIVTRHRIQAFSPAYFRGEGRLFSYSEENCRAAAGLLQGPKDPVPFVSHGLSVPEERWKTLGIDDLCSFYAHPARFILNRRLGVYLEERVSLLEEKEAFDMADLDRYHLEQTLLEKGLQGKNPRSFFQVARASGLLPHGSVGECLYEDLVRGVEQFVEATRPFIHEAPLEPLEVDREISGFRLKGRIHGIYPSRRISYRYARVKGRDLLRAWIHHVILNAFPADPTPGGSMLVGLDPDEKKDSSWMAWEFAPLGEAQDISPEVWRDVLLTLLRTYWEGLSKPLHFFPESSWTYARSLRGKDGSEKEALPRARRRWSGGDYRRGESEDPYYQLCFQFTDPLDGEFQVLSEAIFNPLLVHLREMEDDGLQAL